MVSIYFPTAANKPKPDVATALVISPNTPKGASLITIWVIFIITSNAELKKFRKNSECLESIRVKPTPRKMAKKIIPSISPDAAALNGFKGIIRIKISAGEPGVCSLEWSNDSCRPRFTPLPG